MDTRIEKVTLSLKDIDLNEGQIEGLPANPRNWTKDELKSLALSLTETPELFEMRCPIVVPHDGRYVVLGGNLRIAAARENKEKEVTCFVFHSTSIEKMKEIVIKDNGAWGKWDYDALANEWSDLPLSDWGIPVWEESPQETEAAAGEEKQGENDDKKSYTLTLEFKTKQQKSEWIERAEKEGVKVRRGLNWGRDEDSEHRSTLCPYVQTYKLRGFNYTTSFHNTIKGERLSIIKQNPDNIQIFALAAEELIKRNRVSNPCILLSAPPRKHKENNFAVAVCRRISQDLGITYNEEAIEVINKDRFRPLFKLNICLDGYSTVIIYDDIVTTGKTLLEMKRIIGERQTLVIAGLKNDHPINLE